MRFGRLAGSDGRGEASGSLAGSLGPFHLTEDYMRKLAMLLLLTVLVVACGGDAALAPVSGTVYVNGKPHPNLHVVFQPMGSKENPNPGRGSYGRTDANGRFTLKQYGTDREGAVVAKHRVGIASVDADSKGIVDPETGSPDGEIPESREPIPAKYNDQTELTVDVPKGGSDKVEFKLDVPMPKEKGKKGPAPKK